MSSVGYKVEKSSFHGCATALTTTKTDRTWWEVLKETGWCWGGWAGPISAMAHTCPALRPVGTCRITAALQKSILPPLLPLLPLLVLLPLSQVPSAATAQVQSLQLDTRQHNCGGAPSTHRCVHTIAQVFASHQVLEVGPE